MAAIPLFQNCSYSTQRRILLACFSIYLMLNGLTYSMILSTLWFYLQSFDSEHWFLGLVLSIYSGTGALLAPVIGYYADVNRRTRIFTISSAVVYSLGLFIYSLPFSKYCVVVGIAVSGSAGCVVGVMFGELARITTFEERTRCVSLLEGSRLFGFVLGPCINLVLSDCEFKIGDWRISYGNCSAAFTAILWLLLGFSLFLFQYDLSQTVEAKKYIELETFYALEGVDDNEDEKDSGIEKFIDMADPYGSGFITDDDDEDIELHRGIIELDPGPLKDLCRAEIIVLLWVNFFMSFVLASSSTVAPLIAKEQLHWKKMFINILFIGTGLGFLVSVLIVAAVSRILHDRQILLFATGLQTCFLPLMFLIAYFKDIHTLTAVFLTAVVLVSLNGPCFIISVRSLLSKLSLDHLKSFNQGVLITVISCAELVGPLLGALMYDHFVHFALLVNVINIATLIATITVYKHLKVTSDQQRRVVNSLQN